MKPELYTDCADSGPNGPANPRHQHGQTDLLLALVQVLIDVPTAVEGESQLHAAPLDVPLAEGHDVACSTP